MMQLNVAHVAICVAAKEFGVTPDDLLGRSRQKPFTMPRMIAMYATRMVTGEKYSLPFIGAQFDRDHTTVIHAIRTVKAKRANEFLFRHRVDAVVLETNLLAGTAEFFRHGTLKPVFKTRRTVKLGKVAA